LNKKMINNYLLGGPSIKKVRVHTMMPSYIIKRPKNTEVISVCW